MTTREDPKWIGPSTLSERELVWASLQPFLSQRGYMLRQRYRPSWKPSWTTRAEFGWGNVEDALEISGHGDVLDAVRLSDKTSVVLKKVKTTGLELPLTVRMSSAPLASDPMNHSPPVLDVLMLPESDEFAIFVMPKMHRFNRPLFETSAEVYHCLRELIKGLSFLHSHNIAHRDIDRVNVLMCPGNMFPLNFHFASKRDQYQPGDILNSKARLEISPHISRTLGGVNYCIIDYGLSETFTDPKLRHVWGRVGHVDGLDIPEIGDSAVYDPFPVDVFCLAWMFKNEFLNHYPDWEQGDAVMKWVDKMMVPNPKERPTAKEALEELDDMIRSVPKGEMDRPLTSKKKRNSGLLRHETRAIMFGKNTLYRDLYAGLGPEYEKIINPSLPSRLISVVRNAVWRS